MADNTNDILEPTKEERNFEKEIRKMQIKIGDYKLLMAKDETIKCLKNPVPTQASPDTSYELKKAQRTLRIEQQKANFEEIKTIFARKWKENVIDFEEYKKGLPQYLR